MSPSPVSPQPKPPSNRLLPRIHCTLHQGLSLLRKERESPFCVFSPILIWARRKSPRKRDIPSSRRVYTLEANSIYPSVKRYIPFGRIVYTFRSKGIYLTTTRNIPHSRKVYSSRQKGIFLTAERYIPHDRKEYSSRQKGIFLTTERYIPHDRKEYSSRRHLPLLRQQFYPARLPNRNK